jgi:ATP-dependent Clp protease ATP-binding subunit ClpB
MSEFLLNGSEVLKSCPNFKLIGRKDILNDLCGILTQSSANSVIACGAGGVGISALALGLQARKLDDDAPFDIVNKRFFWLETDGLFGLGDNTAIQKEFQTIFNELNRTPDSVLIVEDTLDLIEALRNCGMLHVINALNAMVKSKKTQVFLEVRDKDLTEVYKIHSDFREHYTFFQVEEPTGAELDEIVNAAAKNLESYYSVRIDPKAVTTAITLTNKYRALDTGLNRAQPERSRLLLDRSMSKYCLYAHSVPAMGKEEEFIKNQELIKKYFALQRQGEKSIILLEQEIAKLIELEKNGNASDKKHHDPDFDLLGAASGYSTPAIEEKRATIAQLTIGVADNRAKYQAITSSINDQLALTSDHVVNEFSRIAGIEAAKLKQDDKTKLLALGTVLKWRVFGQDDALEYVYKAVKIWRRGRRTGKPLPFMFCGPSGVGKTECGRGLAEGLFDTVAALNKFDMGEFMEKNDATKLIGAPPGYEGFEVGGQMTNSIRNNPYQVMLWDEIEKAHQAIYNILLGILDEGSCKDNIGRKCEFGDALMPFTTNIGQEHMLNKELSDAEAYERTMHDLEQFFKPEFLNRFEGRENILVFRSLELDSIRRIANRELDRINSNYAPNIQAVFPSDQLNAFCEKTYHPKIGARGIPGRIKTVEGFIVDKQLEDENFVGMMDIAFDGTNLKTSWSQNGRQNKAA